MGGRPNILFVFTDQHTRGALSAWGNRFLHTPHLDSLARNGVMFWNSYCAAPVCGPSRASLVTGRMPHETGVEWNGLPLPAHFPTLGEVFRQAGYKTAWAGPWHLSEYYPTADSDLRGFRHLGVPRSPLEHLGTHVDEPITTRAIEFLRQPRRQPFFLGVSLVNPHDICFWIMERDREMLNQFLPKGELPPLPDNFVVDPDEPEFIKICRQRDHYGNEQRWTTSWDETMWRTYLAAYYRMVEHADASLGRILAVLRERGLEDDTLVVFTSDHGEGVAAHRWVVKLMLYEETVAVPFIISCKGRIPPGRVDRTHLVSGIDVMPTLCDYAGISPPQGLHGNSLKEVIEDPSAAGRDFVVSELLPDLKNTKLKGRMLRTRRYKYIEFSRGRAPEQFFDLDLDPGETRNLVASPGHQSELRRHRDLLAQWTRETNDSFHSHCHCDVPAI